ncbi:fructose-specific PTS transporter subunit EIIC [Spiroplasma endosymbiont of Monopis laevigella]
MVSKQDDILTVEHVFLESDCKTQAEAFQEIATSAKKLGFLKKNISEKSLVNSFLQREGEGTTGFGDGVAVPHARNEDIVKSGIFIMRFKQPIPWKALDEQPVKAIIALIVPLKSAGNEHLEILSKVAQRLTKPEFQSILFNSKDKKAIIQSLNINNKPNVETSSKTISEDMKGSSKKTKNIIAITACPVGVAHTYIAQDKLEIAAKNLGYNIKVETHGSIGIKGAFTATDIANADLVIIAVSAGVADLKLERFNNKPLYKVEISKVIKNPESIVNDAFANAKPYEINKSESGQKAEKENKSNDLFTTDKQGIMKHIMAGVGYMVPFVVFGGIMLALSIGIAKAVYGADFDISKLPHNHFLYFMNQAGSIAFTLMIPILAGFIANSIAGRAALVPAMVSAYVANTAGLVYPIAGLEPKVSAGFLGALLIGPSVGYLVRWIITWKVPKTIAPIMPIFFIPIVVTFLISFTFIYAIGAPIGWIMEQFQNGLTHMPREAMAAIGMLLGAMVGFDMGGPINKVAFLAASTTITADPSSQLFMGAVAAAIPVAPLGMGLTTLIFRKFFNESERTLGLTAMLMGCIGISEGAIPFAVRDPKRAIISNIIGSAVAGSIAGTFLLTDAAGHGGPIVAILGAVSSVNYVLWVSILLFFLAIIVGSIVTCLVYGGLLIIQSRNIKVFKLMNERIMKIFNSKKSKSKNSKNKV